MIKIINNSNLLVLILKYSNLKKQVIKVCKRLLKIAQTALSNSILIFFLNLNYAFKSYDSLYEGYRGD